MIRGIPDTVVRLKIVPATRGVWDRCLADGLIDVFMKAGALVGFHTDDGITDSRFFLRSAALAVTSAGVGGVTGWDDAPDATKGSRGCPSRGCGPKRYFFRPTRANLLRNFSTRPPRLSTLFCVPV